MTSPELKSLPLMFVTSMCNKGKSGVPAAGLGTDISTQANVYSAPTIYQTGIRIYDVLNWPIGYYIHG